MSYGAGGEYIYGFRWGPVEVTRAASFPRPNGDVRVLILRTDAGREMEIAVSPTGRNVRVFSDGKEWKP